MKQGSTLFLRIVIYLFGLAVLGLCGAALYVAIFSLDNTGMYLPILIGLNVTALPFFIALYQGLQLLKYIDQNTAFSEQSVKAIKNIKFCAYTISAMYAIGLPYIFYVADKMMRLVQF